MKKSNSMKWILIIVLNLVIAISGHCQVGGDNIYEFLNTSPSARVTGLGGNLITVNDTDVSLGYANPASLNESMHQAISFNYNFHLAGISDGYAAYAHYLEKPDLTVHAAIKFINYGEFDQTDVFGNIIGNFSASENALILGASKKLYEKLTVGSNIKVISSRLENYNSFGLALDAAAMYHDTSSQFNVTLLAKNIGSQLSNYQDLKEDIPFEMQIGLSKRLKYLPLRWSVIYHNLNRWNILYDDPDSEETTVLIGDEETSRSPSEIFFDNFGRHFIFNAEFLFGKNEMFNVRLGYNHLLKKELSVSNLRSVAGFSFGLGFRLKMFQIAYGHQFYHLAGGTNHFTISTNLTRFTNPY